MNVFLVAIAGSFGFLTARIISGVRRTFVDNAVVWVFSVTLAVVFCMVISLGWSLENQTYAAISFAYVFLMDKSRMVQSWFSR